MFLPLHHPVSVAILVCMRSQLYRFSHAKRLIVKKCIRQEKSGRTWSVLLQDPVSPVAGLTRLSPATCEAMSWRFLKISRTYFNGTRIQRMNADYIFSNSSTFQPLNRAKRYQPKTAFGEIFQEGFLKALSSLSITFQKLWTLTEKRWTLTEKSIKGN